MGWMYILILSLSLSYLHLFYLWLSSTIFLYCVQEVMLRGWSLAHGELKISSRLGPGLSYDKLGISARFKVVGCPQIYVEKSPFYGCVARHTYKGEATRHLGIFFFLVFYFELQSVVS